MPPFIIFSKLETRPVVGQTASFTHYKWGLALEVTELAHGQRRRCTFIMEPEHVTGLRDFLERIDA